MVLILIPRKPEEIYLLYEKNDNKCKSLPLKKPFKKDPFIFVMEQNLFILLKTQIRNHDL